MSAAESALGAQGFDQSDTACPVCIGMLNQIAHNPNDEASDQACIELDLHPNHRMGAEVWAARHPEWTEKVR